MTADANEPVAPTAEHLLRDAPGAAASSSPKVIAVLFDLGDVLYDATVWRRWLLHTLARLGLHARYRSLFYLWDHDFLETVHRGQRDYDEAFRAFLRAAGLTPPQVEEVEAASRTQRREIARTARPLPGVRATLERLQQMSLRLGIVSDSESTADELRWRLDRWGLASHFTTIVSSRDLGLCKPDPRCYYAALERLDTKPDRAVFVGHDIEELDGARAIGLRTVAFNYEPGARADVFLERFAALDGAIRGWNDSTAAA